MRFMKLKCVAIMLIVILFGLFSETVGYARKIDNKPLYEGIYLNGHSETYGKMGDYKIHSSKVELGENSEYIFAMVFSSCNCLQSEGFTHSGLYKNDGENTPVYLLPEIERGCYAEISQDGQEVWLFATEWLPWRLENIDMSFPLIRYFKGGELQYTVRLSDLFTEEKLLRNGAAQEGMRWYGDFYKGQTNFILTYSDYFLSENPIDELYFIDRYTGKTSNNNSDNNNESALLESESESTENPNDNNSFNIMWLILGGVCVVGCIAFLFLRKKSS